MKQLKNKHFLKLKQKKYCYHVLPRATARATVRFEQD